MAQRCGRQAFIPAVFRPTFASPAQWQALNRSEDRRKRRPTDHASPVSFVTMFRYRTGSTQPCRGFPSRHRSWDLALRSLIPACGRRPTSSIAAGPTCRFLSVHPDRWFMLSGDQPSLIQIRHPCACDAPTFQTQGAMVDPGRSPRLLGLARKQSAPRRRCVSTAVDAALGFDRSCRCSDTAALLAPHASHARNIASIVSPGGPFRPLSARGL